ncbi:MAG TPA: hypothetical protein VKR38_14205 [Usitatibacter sp.]|nr:hypothetical protein [Usitatibacter sp.]
MTPQSTAITAGIALLVAWRMYSRIRRLVGRQKSKAWRHWLTLVIFPSVLMMFAIVAFTHPESEAALAGGIAVGVGLGVWGLRKTRFEATPAGYFYTPNAHIGIALSVLLLARIAYRFYEVSVLTAAQPMPDFGRSPLTLLVFGTLAGYYTAYAAGILRWRASTPLPSLAEAETKP